MNRRARQRGVTLIELVVSIVIIGIAVSAVLGVFTMTTQRSVDAMVRQQAVAVAEAYLEEILLKPFADPDGANGETRRTDFDDIEDYNGLDDATGACDQLGNPIDGLQSYRVDVRVEQGALNGLPANDVRRVDVRVRHVTGLTLRLSGYRTRY